MLPKKELRKTPEYWYEKISNELWRFKQKIKDILKQPNMYGIRATNRLTKKREFIRKGMTEKDAKSWKPNKSNKQTHTYFRVAKVK